MPPHSLIPLQFKASIILFFLGTLSFSWTNNSLYGSKIRTSIPLMQLMENNAELDVLLTPNPNCDPSQMSPTSLAYIGDSVFELFIRSRYVWPSRRTNDLQNVVVGRVRAETQSKIFRTLVTSDTCHLTKEEQTIISRGRNAGSSTGGRKRGPKRLYGINDKKTSAAGNGGGPEIYQDSTAMEALIGYIYLTDKSRCAEIMKFISAELDKMDVEEGVIR